MWQSKPLCRIAKSAMAAESFIQVQAAEACFWLAKLFNEIVYNDINSEKGIMIQCYTDNHQLYDAVQSIRPIQDKRLTIEMNGIIK